MMINKTITPLVVCAVAVLLSACEDKKDDSDLFKMNLPAQSQASTTSPGTAPTPSKAIVPYVKNTKSISRRVAIEELAKNNYFESVVSEVEGFRASFYHDNIGVATGNGWNVSMQSIGTNTAITSAIAMSPSDSASIIAISTNKTPQASLIPKTLITPAQATKAAQVMRDMNFEPIAIKALKKPIWDLLTPYQKAVINYHVYKTGNLNWTNLKANIIACAKSQTQEVCKRAADGFTYSYMLNGVRMYDTRSQLYMSALFLDPAAYAYLLGTQAAPGNFTAITNKTGMNLDPTKPAEPQIDQQDTFTPAKEQMLEEGRSFELNVVIPESERPAQKTFTPRAHLPTGYMG